MDIRTAVFWAQIALGVVVAGPILATSDMAPAAHDEASLRAAIWSFEQSLREQVLGVQGPDDSGELEQRLLALRAAAFEVTGGAGQLVSKLEALRPLLRELEAPGLGPRSGAPWGRASEPSQSIQAHEHRSCSTARSVVDGLTVTSALGPEAEVWLRYTPLRDGLVLATTTGSGFDTELDVYDGCPAAGGKVIGQGDDELGLQARATFAGIPGRTYWLRARGWQGAPGFLAVRVEGGFAGLAGAVTHAATGVPLRWRLSLWDELGQFVAHLATDEEGRFSAAVAAGVYYLSTAGSLTYWPETLLDQLYQGIGCAGGAPLGCVPTGGTPIVVPEATTVVGIDFALGPGGRVTGRVVDSVSGLAIPSLRVDALSSGGWIVASTSTDVVGRYSLGGQFGTTYVLAAAAPSSPYRPELHDDIPCSPTCSLSDGTPAEVVDGETSPGIDFALVRFGSISGRVIHAASSEPVAYGSVRIWSELGSLVRTVLSDANGDYSSGGLPDGVYYVSTANDNRFVDQLWDALPCWPTCDVSSGTPIAVSLGVTTPGIDFALERTGSVSGEVLEAGSGIELNSFVRLYDGNGALVQSGYSYESAGYRIERLAPGNYFLVASSDAHRTKLFDDIACPLGPPTGCNPTSGTPVTVHLNAEVSGITFELDRLGSISGSVTDAQLGTVLDYPIVSIWNQAGELVAVTQQYSGGWHQTGLEPGSYTVTAEHPLYQTGLYDGIACAPAPSGCDPTNGTPVPVTLGSETPGVDLALERKGSISGVLRDHASGQPIAGYGVARAYDSAGTLVQSVSTASGGVYQLDGLEGGNYFVSGSAPGYSWRLYDDLPCSWGCLPTVGTPVAVVVGATSAGIDLDLRPAGTIAGVVSTTVGGASTASVAVRAYNTLGQFEASTNADSNGNYSLQVPAGTWFVVARGGIYAAQLFDGMECPNGWCDVVSGTPVSVTSQGTTAGIDFLLSPARGIVGRVTDRAGNSLPGVAIDVWDLFGVLVASAEVGTDGLFYVNPGAGAYHVSTDNGLGALDEVWNDVPCPLGPAHDGLCDPTTGDTVELPTSATLVSEIDFVLSAVPIFADGFESGDPSGWSQVSALSDP